MPTSLLKPMGQINRKVLVLPSLNILSDGSAHLHYADCFWRKSILIFWHLLWIYMYRFAYMMWILYLYVLDSIQDVHQVFKCIFKVWTIVVAYILAVSFMWSPDSKRYLRYLSMPVWCVLILHIATVAGYLRVPLFIFLLIVILVGFVAEVREVRKPRKIEGNLSQNPFMLEITFNVVHASIMCKCLILMYMYHLVANMNVPITCFFPAILYCYHKSKSFHHIEMMN